MTRPAVALCLRASAPPPEHGARADDPALAALRATVAAVTDLAEALEPAVDGAVTLALAPVVLQALAEEVVVALRGQEARGTLEVGTTGATDAWLPALGPGGGRAQIGIACATHRRRLARQPLGFWPRGLALSAHLCDDVWPLGVRWVLAAPAALALGRPPQPDAAVAFHPRGVAVLAARPLADADAALAAARPAPDGAAPLVVLAADILEAPAALARLAALDAEPVTPSLYLARARRHPECAPAALAGADVAARGPYAEALALLRALRQVEAALGDAARQERRPRRVPAGPQAVSELLRRRALVQAAREALLAACADWPALGAYGERRFRAHAVRAAELLAGVRGAQPLDAVYLNEVEARDEALGDEVDPSWFAG